MIYSKNLPQNIKIVISRSNLKISKIKKKKCFESKDPSCKEITVLGKKLWPTGRRQTDTHTHTQADRQTDRQTKKVNTENPFFPQKKKSCF